MRITLFCLLFACVAAKAAPIVFQSPQRQVSLLELYTSEGCSSCPPAEAWLSKLKNSSGLWNEFVPVAFHVDYWNNLGWKDRFSDEQYADRQRNYAQLWSASDIYTPEFVLNGKEWHDWMGFRGAPSLTESEPGVLQVKSNDGKHWEATFLPSQADGSGYEVTAAVLWAIPAQTSTPGKMPGGILIMILSPYRSSPGHWISRPMGFRANSLLILTPGDSLEILRWPFG